MDPDHCGDQTRLRSIQPLRAGFRTAGASGRETHWTRPAGGLQAVQLEYSWSSVSRRNLDICLPFLTFKRWHFGNHFYLAVFSRIYVCCNFWRCNFKTNLKKNSDKFLQGTNFSKSTLAEETEIIYVVKHLILLFLTHQAENKHMWENLPLLYTLNISGWVAVVKESLFQVLLFDHIIILVAGLP